MGQTKIVAGPSRARWRMRALERRVQAGLEHIGAQDLEPVADVRLSGVAVPPWARGVRVERVGLFQWALVATSWRGR